VDLSTDEVHPRAPWVQECSKAGGGGGQGGSGCSLSGLSEQLLRTGTGEHRASESKDVDEHGMVKVPVASDQMVQEQSLEAAWKKYYEDNDSPEEGCAWNQEEEEVTVRIPVLAGTAAKAIKVKFSRLTVSCMVASEPILEGKLGGPIDVDESTWTLADGVLELTLTKVDNDRYKNYWGSLLID